MIYKGKKGVRARGIPNIVFQSDSATVGDHFRAGPEVDVFMSHSLLQTIEEVWVARFALLNLVLKDFRVRYRNMSLGFMWSVLNPLVILGVLSFVFTFIFKQDQPYFPVFLLLGLVAFNFFSLCLSAVTPAIFDNAALVKKVVFPRIVIPVSVVLSQLIHVLIQLLLLGMFILIFSVPITRMYLWMPVLYFIELLFVLGVSLICCALCVYFRDTRYLVESGLSILFWFTPIFYSLANMHDSLPKAIYAMYLCNPLAGCIEAARRVVLHGVAPDMISLAFAAGIAVATLVLGIAVFSRLQRNFADNI